MRRTRVVAHHVLCQPVASKSMPVKDESTGKEFRVSVDGDTVTAAEVTKIVAELAKGTATEVPSKQQKLRNQVSTGCVELIGAPFADGQNLVGNELFPTAMRDAGLEQMIRGLGWDYKDSGDLALEGTDLAKKEKMIASYRSWVHSGTMKPYIEWSGVQIRSPESVHVAPKVAGDPYESVPNGELIGACNKLIYDKVLETASAGNFALTVGGDHSIGSATLAAMIQAYPNLAVVWVDAHADANTPETSPSLHYHGMPAAHAMGWFKKTVKGFEWLKKFVPESSLAYIGLRDIDPEEGRMLQQSGCHVYTVAHIDRLGISQVVTNALNRIDPYNNRPVHLTFDIDSIDPVYAPGTGTLARGGLTYREAHYICEELASTGRLVGMDVVEVNPLVDQIPERMHGDDPSLNPTSLTVHLAVELALSGLGKNILGIEF